METFVLRVFVPATDEEHVLTGIVEHSTSGWSKRFRGVEGLATALLAELCETGVAVIGEGCDVDGGATRATEEKVLEDVV